MQKIIKALIITLAVLAAVIAVGLIAGYAMQPFIVSYWVVLVMKNLCDYVKARWNI